MLNVKQRLDLVDSTFKNLKKWDQGLLEDFSIFSKLDLHGMLIFII